MLLGYLLQELLDPRLQSLPPNFRQPCIVLFLLRPTWISGEHGVQQKASVRQTRDRRITFENPIYTLPNPEQNVVVAVDRESIVDQSAASASVDEEQTCYYVAAGLEWMVLMEESSDHAVWMLK